MFRSTLRSFAGPVRSHVCRSCLLARKIERPIGGLRCYTTALSESEHGVESPLKPNVPRDLSHGNQEKSSSTENDAVSDVQDKQTANMPDEEEVTDSTEPNSDQSAEDGKKTKDRAESKQETGVRKEVKKNKKPTKGNQKKLKGVFVRRVESTVPEKSPISEAKRSRKRPDAGKDSEGDNKLSYLASIVKEKHSGYLRSSDLSITPLAMETSPVPHLSFGLDRVLFNPGVYHLRDPRSRVFNFDPYLGSIMPVTEFDFESLKQYITSSKDEALLNLAHREKRKYVGSSSSMTSVLSHFHYLLSAWRPVNTDSLSRGFPDKMQSFTRLLRSPAAMFLHYKDGVYAIDADKEFETANILMNLGKSMEKLLTLPKEEFERYRRSSTNKITPEEEGAMPESYHYSTVGDFVMRSQLDAYDPRLPGSGMFDLKTRAVVSIRMDARNFEHGLGYEIKDRFGGYESYEREYFDMIRAAFLKYSLQVRVGRMDGIFVAFHNIERIFGFQYISLPEMDEALHGQRDTTLGDKEFQISLALWNNILNKATAKYPQQCLRFHFETRDAQTPYMYIFVRPVTAEEIEAIQTKNQEEIDKFQRRILNLQTLEDGDASADDPLPTDFLEEPESTESKELEAADHTEQSAETQTQEKESKEEEPQHELFAMLLSVENTINNRPVLRPLKLTEKDEWTVAYELSEIQGKQVWPLYKACQLRREKALSGRGEDEADVATNVYIRKLRELSKNGREYRKEQNQLDEEQGVVVLSETESSSITR